MTTPGAEYRAAPRGGAEPAWGGPALGSALSVEHNR
jgi:hypothetical protein